MKPLSVLSRFLRSHLSLRHEESEQSTYEEIRSGAAFSSYNLWILGFAMFIACIGLNTDSASAVIGAMLISPLMGPIAGYAFALAIRDAPLRNSSIRNWLWMTFISLMASTGFFLLSPFDNDTHTLLSFTRASIFDILIALFGGMAGFIGILKRDGVKVIAGVAVATACMPPLCTAGFGLAHGNWGEFAGGLYFYLINCLFIGLSTFLLARFSGFHHYFRQKGEAPVHPVLSAWLWTGFILFMLVPGVLIAWQKWQEEKHPEREIISSDRARIQQLERRVAQLDSLLRYRSLADSASLFQHRP